MLDFLVKNLGTKLCLSIYDTLKLKSFDLSKKIDYDHIGNSHTRRVIKHNNNKRTWFVFLGIGLSFNQAKDYKLYPKDGTTIIYTNPMSFVNKNPEVVKKIFLEVLGDVKNDMEAVDPRHKISVISYSASNGYGFHTANNYKVEKFYAIVTGTKLGYEIFLTPALRKIKKDIVEFGYKNSKTYDEVLGDLLPYYQTRNLPKKTTLVLGLFDSYIPYEAGRKMYKQVARHNKNTKIITLPFGHSLTAYFFGKYINWKY